MDDRGIIPTSGGIAHPTTGSIIAMMGGINPIPGSTTPMTCCIIPIRGKIVLLLIGGCHCSNDGQQSSYSGWQISNDG
jgi:hypothetical protein